MSEPRSLSADLRASIDARKEVHPLEFRVCNLEKQLPEIKRGLVGNNWSNSTTLGFIRETTATQAELIDRIVSLESESDNLKAAIGSLQADLAAAMRRIEGSAKWAATISEWAKDRGMT